MEDNTLTTRDYLVAISEGELTGHTTWSKIGFTPYANTADFDIWSYGGAGATTNTPYVFPTAATAMAVVGGAADDGTPTLYDGTSTGGSTTSLIDTGKKFHYSNFSSSRRYYYLG